MNAYEIRIAKAQFEISRGNTASVGIPLPEQAAAHYRNAAQIAPSPEDAASALAEAERLEEEGNNTLALNSSFVAAYAAAIEELKRLESVYMDAEEDDEDEAEEAFDAYKAYIEATFGPQI